MNTIDDEDDAVIPPEPTLSVAEAHSRLQYWIGRRDQLDQEQANEMSAVLEALAECQRMFDAAVAAVEAAR